MWSELKILLPYVRPFRSRYVLGALCIVLAIVLKVLIPQFLGESIDTLRHSGSQDASAEELAPLITRSVLSIVGIALLGGVIRTSSRLWILGTSRQAIHGMRNAVFDKLLVLQPSYYVRTPTGHIMSRAVNDVTYVQSLLGPVFMYMAETLLLYAVCITAMLRIDSELMLYAIAPFPFFLWFARYQARKIQTGARAAQQRLAEISAKVDESLSGQLVIKTLALEDFVQSRFQERCEEYRRLNLEVTRARGTLWPMMMGLGSLSIFVLLLIGGPRVVRGELSLGDFAKMMLYLQMMAAPTGALGFVISSLQRGTAALGRLREIFEEPVTLVDPPELGVRSVTRGELSVRGLTIELENLPEEEQEDPAAPKAEESERYVRLGGASGQNGREEPTSAPRLARRVLDDVSFDVPAGRTLGVVGLTGSGKSVLAAALARQIEVERGQVFIDSHDIVDLPLDEVRRHVGFVPQETFLFGATLADNVALGEPNASRERVEEAARIAQIAKDLGQLPEGLDTMLGERGVNLSGGQRQRTALARAVLLRPRILILDDTLSAVDADTAEEILDALQPVMGERTTVLIAHRIATLQHADDIIVLDEGRVVERGDHASLIAGGGLYASLYAEQMRREARTKKRELEWPTG